MSDERRYTSYRNLNLHTERRVIDPPVALYDAGTVARATSTFESPHGRVVVTEYADGLASFLVWITDDHAHAYREGDFSMLTREAPAGCFGCAEGTES